MTHNALTKRAWAPFLAWLLLVTLPAAAAVDTAGLVSVPASDMTVTATFRSYNSKTKIAAYQAKLINGAKRLRGPVYLVIESLTGTGVTVANATGTTSGGKPYYLLASGDLAPKTGMVRSLNFSNPSNSRVTFTTAVYQSPPGPVLDTSTLTKAIPTQATATAAFKSFNRNTLESTYEVNVKNVSGGLLTGPVYLVLEALTGAGVTASNALGATTGALPYYLISVPDLAAGATNKISVILSNPSNARISFKPAVYLSSAVSALSLIITKPATLITVGSTPLAIEGTVSDATAQVTVNGAPVTTPGGNFQASVALTEGHNTVIARAVKGAQESTATISVSLDLTPPYITVDSPAADSIVNTKFITVSGLINDIVRGTVSEGQANVTVNGKPAAVANRTYLVEDVELVEGLNTLTISASDQVGNTSTIQSKVTYKIAGLRRIESVGGDGQRAQIRATVSQPLAIKLIDDLGGSVAGKPVVFRVVDGDGAVGDQGQALVIDTNGAGEASVPFKLGSRAGNGNNHVTAKAVGYDGQVEFFASADPKPGDKVSVNSGNNQRGAAKQPLPLPFVVVVTDDGANVLKGQQIQFDVTVGGGKFLNGETSQTAITDSDGRASATFVLGSETGLDSQRVTAKLVGTALYAGFTASALASGDPGQTSVSGVVLDNQDKPLPDVTVRVEGTTRQAKSNAQGQFKVTEVPVGPIHLIVDGSTTTAAGEWPTLPYNLVTVAGADNPLPAPVYMVKLDTEHSVWVGKEDKVITVPELPGFQLSVKKGSVTFPNGDREGYLSVTPVNASKVPMSPPNGMQPQLIVTIQPTGARFDPPAALQMPNVDGHAPGAQVEMYSFDHDLEEFVTIGLGTVSADGRVITSNPGVGVIKAGWHCGSQPGGSGCGHNCGYCKDCAFDCSCQPAPNDPSVPKCGSCSGGNYTPPPTDAECCSARVGTRTDLLGGVTCCRGTDIVCMFPGNFTPSGNTTGDGIVFDCIKEHEENHAKDQWICAETDCKLGGNWGNGYDKASGECAASKAEIECYNRRKPDCSGNAACEQVLADWIQEAKDYANGFGSCF